MSIKVIAIGNQLMGDDGIALYVAEYLSNSLAEVGIEVIIGETDIDFCISKINNDDELIIIDCACRGDESGSVYSVPLYDAVADSGINSWQHDRDLIRELKIKGLKVPGLLLCIEVSDIDFRWGLSAELQQNFPEICSKICKMIFQYRGELENAR